MAFLIPQRLADWFVRKSSLGHWLTYNGIGADNVANIAPVSPSTAFLHPAAACAIRVISEAVATLPIHVYERQSDGSKVRASDHPAYALLHDDANDWTSAYDLKLSVTVDALTNDKGGFILVNRVNGRPFELLRLDPAFMTVTYNSVGEPSYKFDQRTLDRADVIHIRAPGGIAPLTTAREAIALAAEMEGHGKRLFRNGGRPAGLLSLASDLTTEAVANVRSAWDLAHGAGKSGGTAVLPKGATFTPLAFTSVDSQFLELRTFQNLEVARAFRVPPHMMFELGRATWANSEQMGQEFLTFTLLPWLEAWTGAIRRALFSPNERDTYISEFLVDDLLRADLQSRADSYAKLIAARVLSPNEARAMENRPAYPGGDRFENPNTTTGTAAEASA